MSIRSWTPCWIARIALTLGLAGCQGAASVSDAPATTSTPVATSTPSRSPAATAVAAAAADAAPGAEGEGSAEVAPSESPTGDIEFSSVADLKQNPLGIEPQLRRGIIANSAEWPASLYVTFQTPQGTAACTAALIGPQVMLTAAHCVPVTGKVGFRYDGETYATQCTRHPRYVSGTDASADFALCKIERPFVAPTGFKFEFVESTLPAQVGDNLVLTGFGCISDVVASAAADGMYRYGTTSITETSASPQQSRGPAYYSPRQGNNLFTTDDPKAPNLCPGDSGGPAFRREPGPSLLVRRIVGVNSRVFYRDAGRTSYGASLVSMTGGDDFRSWARDWTTAAQLSACGIAGAIPNCRP